MKYADRSYAEIVSICMMLNNFNPSNIQNLSNKSTMNRIVNEMFKEINSFSKLIFIFEISNKKNRASRAKFIFRFFFSKYVNMADINAL